MRPKLAMLRLCANQISYVATLCDPIQLCCNFARPNLAMFQLCATIISYVATLCDSSLLRDDGILVAESPFRLPILVAFFSKTYNISDTLKACKSTDIYECEFLCTLYIVHNLTLTLRKKRSCLQLRDEFYNFFK